MIPDLEPQHSSSGQTRVHKRWYKGWFGGRSAG